MGSPPSCNMGVQINHYSTPEDHFDKLRIKYPTGRYGSRNGTNWFNVYIKEMDLELSWFMEKTWGAESEE